jgi:tetratricopeptide (TPR) repeat protein
MSFWKKLFGDDTETVDYYNEGVELQRVGKYHEALTSFRLALRDSPRDAAVLEQIAVTYTRIGMTDEAVKTYRTVLSDHPGSSAAHYGLAFLLLRQGHGEEAEQHLRAFLAAPPGGADASRHVTHAQAALRDLERGIVPEAGA